jgi:hypothetical protein
LKTLAEDKQEMAIQGKVLYDEVEIDCQILEQELERRFFHMVNNKLKLKASNCNVTK